MKKTTGEKLKNALPGIRFCRAAAQIDQREILRLLIPIPAGFAAKLNFTRFFAGFETVFRQMRLGKRCPISPL